jgi:arylsulfatase A-like enzyme
MRAASLFAVLAAAHGLMLLGREVPLSAWTPLAYLWQDALVALAFAVVDRATGRPRALWVLYALAVGYAALNVAVVRVLPSPLTPAMLRAARGTLADSVLVYVTPANVALCAAVAGLGVALPFVLRRVDWRRFGPVAFVLAAACVAVGPLASARLETGGAHRNAFAALLPASLPASPPAGRSLDATADFRASPFAAAESLDLGWLRGAAAGRNVVLVILESAGARYLRPYGATEDAMPNLMRLAERAVRFERAYAVYPESIKGLYSALCSRYPALGVPAEALATADCEPLAARLGAAGYRSALFHSGRFSYLGMQALVDEQGFDTLADAGTLSGRVDSSFGIDEATAVDALLAWIDAPPRPPEPFFVAYLPIAGHHPYATVARGPFEPVDDRHRYLNALHEADAALGTLLDGLAERGLAERTLFVVFGDHGEAFGQHRGNIGHSFFLYDENVHVPYFIAAPGLIEAPLAVARPISIVDTTPTILDLLGAADVHGSVDRAQPLAGRSALLGTAQTALFLTDYAQSWLGLYDHCWKYLFDVAARRSELYDVCADPAETLDRAPGEAARVAVYKSSVLSWARAVQAAMPRGE